MRKFTDLLFKREGGEEKEPSEPPKVGDDGPSSDFPKLKISVLGRVQPTMAIDVPEIPAVEPVQGEAVAEDPHLDKVVKLVQDRVHALAGSSYQQFCAVRERMKSKLGSDQDLDLSLVCAAIDVSGRELVEEVMLMEQGLKTAELEVGNEIDTDERNTVLGLESEIGGLNEAVQSRQTRITDLEEQLKSLRREQGVDQQSLTQKQGKLREQKAFFNASRQRLRAARALVAQDLGLQKQTFRGL